MPEIKIPNIEVPDLDQLEQLGQLEQFDYLIFGGLIIGSLIYAFAFVGRGRVVPVLVSTYMSFVLVEFMPALSEGVNQKIMAFVISFVVLFFILSRVILQSPVGSETFGFLGTLLLSLAQIGFLEAVIISFLPQEITSQFSEWAGKLFLSKDVFFYWAAAPIILLIVLGIKANRDLS